MGLNVIWKVGLGALLLAPGLVSAQDRRITGTVTRSGTTMPLEDVEISETQPRSLSSFELLRSH